MNEVRMQQTLMLAYGALLIVAGALMLAILLVLESGFWVLAPMSCVALGALVVVRAWKARLR